jgi:WD40 repeat protein
MTSTGGSRALQRAVQTGEMYGAFSPDRSRLLTGGDGPVPKVHIWDIETGNCLHTLTGHKEPVAALAWTGDQRWAASTDAFAFGMRTQASALPSWIVTGPTSVPWTSAGRESNSSPDAETELSACGKRQPARCCKCLKVTLTAPIMLFSTQPGLESYREAATGRSGSGRLGRGAA